MITCSPTSSTTSSARSPRGNQVLVDPVCAPRDYVYVASTLDNLREKGNPDWDTPVPPVQFGYLVWSDPYEQQLGGLRAYRPGFGQFTGECDAYGRVVIDRAAVEQVLDESEDLAEFHDRIDRRLGVVWTDPRVDVVEHLTQRRSGAHR